MPSLHVRGLIQYSTMHSEGVCVGVLLTLNISFNSVAKEEGGALFFPQAVYSALAGAPLFQ